MESRQQEALSCKAFAGCALQMMPGTNPDLRAAFPAAEAFLLGMSSGVVPKQRGPLPKLSSCVCVCFPFNHPKADLPRPPLTPILGHPHALIQEPLFPYLPAVTPGLKPSPIKSQASKKGTHSENTPPLKVGPFNPRVSRLCPLTRLEVHKVAQARQLRLGQPRCKATPETFDLLFPLVEETGSVLGGAFEHHATTNLGKKNAPRSA